MALLLGCIGDDFTGSSDLANTLARGGMRVVQYAGVPPSPAADTVEAGVVALKSRTIAPDQAVAQSLAALAWLRDQGCRQYFFKYCSTFDSTPAGNIGPVAEALADALGADRVIVCPAFPATGRSVFQGHLFVNDRLLNESGMENHPLTPMTDADLRRWLAPQAKAPVGHVGFDRVAAGVEAIRAALDGARDAGQTLIVVDAVRDSDLHDIGAAAADLPLITGGSGVALGLPGNFRRAGLIGNEPVPWIGMAGPAAVLSGSCSNATRDQVQRYAADHPAITIDPDLVMAGELTGNGVADWLLAHLADGPLAYSSADPESVAAAQARHGQANLATAIERLFADAARRLVAGGVSRLVVAGGETAGAVVTGLDIAAMEIGPEIASGVPALRVAGRDLTLALKSGNFGDTDFFAEALEVLAGG